MKRLVFLLIIVLPAFAVQAQTSEDLVGDCALNAGDNTVYLKDYIIKLPAAPDNPPVHMESMYFIKNTKYRFNLCNSDKYSGQLIMILTDNKDKTVVTTYNEQTGKTYNTLDFECRKTGIYKLKYYFKDGQRGLSVGIVSTVK